MVKKSITESFLLSTQSFNMFEFQVRSLTSNTNDTKLAYTVFTSTFSLPSPEFLATFTNNAGVTLKSEGPRDD